MENRLASNVTAMKNETEIISDLFKCQKYL